MSATLCVLSLDGVEAGTTLPDDRKKLDPYSNGQGLLTTIQSRSPLALLAMCDRTGDFALADDRGKIFTFSTADNSFEVAKKATTIGPLSAMAYLLSKAGVLLLGYATGAVVLYDTAAKKSLAAMQTPSGLSPRLMRCHPLKSMAIMADGANGLSVWDLRIMKATRKLACAEEVVDVQFVDGGAMLALLLRSSGLHLYRCSDMRVALRCPFPDSERKPSWTAMCFAPSTLRGSLRFVLAGDNSALYLWETEVRTGDGYLVLCLGKADCKAVPVYALPLCVP